MTCVTKSASAVLLVGALVSSNALPWRLRSERGSASISPARQRQYFTVSPSITQQEFARGLALSRLPEEIASQSGPKVLVDVSLKEYSAGRCVLRVSVRYVGDKEISIYESSLPWKNTYSMVVVAATPSGQVLRRELPIDDPGPATMALKPGDLLQGEIDLLKRFAGLAAALRKGDVIIFWSYQLWPIFTEPLPRVGGWLLIAKR
jgi:hypothetical protein